MSFLSSVKRVVGAVSTGGLSLLAPKSTQETIGNVALAAQAVGAIGAGAGVHGAGGMAGIGQPGAPEQLSGPPDAGSSPPSGFFNTVSQFAPFGRGKVSAPLPSASSRVTGGMLTSGLTTGGPMDITGGLPTYSDVLPGAQVSGMPGMQPVMAGRIVGQVVLGARNAVRGLIDRAGRFISSSKVAELAERYGLEVAAAGLGVGLAEVAMTIVSHHSHKRRRRGRGISARDMRTTGRTVTKIVRMNEKLRHLCAQGHYTRRAPRSRSPGRMYLPAPTTVVQH
jgi:hypothetical protein